MRIVLSQQFIFICLGCLSFIMGCGESATKTAEACAESDLVAQCPIGTTPDLTAQASSMCDGSGDANLIEQEGAITAACQGTGSCRVVCRFSTPCQCGVDRITEEGVFCVQDCMGAACGNGECESGENSTSCPLDCGMRCMEGSERCNGNDRQLCNQNSVWETVACPDGTQCAEQNGMTACGSGCQTSVYFRDNDGDGFGTSEDTVSACAVPTGYVDNQDDCDDTDPEIKPGTTEVCDDGADNDCNMQIDCRDGACSGIRPCIESDCADGLDNDDNGATDCMDTRCENDPACTAECVDYCGQYLTVCMPPNLDEAQCRTECAAYEAFGEQTIIHQSNTLECRQLYLAHVEDDLAAFCDGAQPRNNNPYCTAEGRVTCETYCALLSRFCPMGFMDYGTCKQRCRDTFAVGEEGMEDLTTAALSCRLDNLQNVASPDGPECVTADHLSSTCPRMYSVSLLNNTFELDGRSVTDFASRANSLVTLRSLDGVNTLEIQVWEGSGPFRGNVLNTTLNRGETASFTLESAGSYSVISSSRNNSNTLSITVVE